ncbi:MAG: phosphoenolpyruvate synthase [Nitrospirae bacterium]|nr:phosphoenolpyruvate synthase [Nitrospirota bacterium]
MNNRVLELMADMEEKLSGEYLFDRQYITSNTRSISEGVLTIIQELNTLSGNKYKEFFGLHDEINKEIESILKQKPDIPVSDFTLPLESLSTGMSNIAGGKTAHLGEIKNLLNLLTPDGFAISAHAFKKFMEHNELADKINDKLSLLNINDMDEINKASGEIQEMITAAEVPHDLRDAINKEVESLKLKVKNSSQFPIPSSRLMVSVRSSAVQEDGEFSFAGQYSTFLNVPSDFILQKYKEVVASLFTQRAIFYYKTKGFSEEEMVMAVGVLEMVNAKAGGVAYTRDPNDRANDAVIINAVRGIGKSVVDGTVNPDSYTVSKTTGAILEKRIANQQVMLVCDPEGGIKEIEVPHTVKGRPCLTDEEIRELYRYALILEEHYGIQQDIEWAIGMDGRLYILQSRPLRILKGADEETKIPRKIEGFNILIDKGVIACKGIGAGNAFVIRNEDDLKNFPEGAVLVAKHTSTKFVTVMNKASAIITDVGGATGHMASISREYQVPTILDAGTATSVIRNGQEITVDAVNCNIYEGKVDELIAYALKKKEPFKDTHLFKALERALKRIVPLNLIDPEDDNFKPEYCKTFHDITRFAHETAMAEMFLVGEGHDAGKSRTITLAAGIPVNAHMIDIDGGIKTGLKKAAPEDILSIPFFALLNGMKSMRWPEPRAADAKGFLGMIAHTASIPEDDIHKTAEKSFAIVSGNYMNFSIRLGYHFSMIEAYAGENINDNYIKFFFKGGGAAADRRLRRVRLITEILKKLDFRVNAVQDVIDAVLTKYRLETIKEKLEIMGKLTAYTKQLDMVMYNDAITDWYIEEFVKEHIKEQSIGNRE